MRGLRKRPPPDDPEIKRLAKAAIHTVRKAEIEQAAEGLVVALVCVVASMELTIAERVSLAERCGREIAGIIQRKHPD